MHIWLLVKQLVGTGEERFLALGDPQCCPPIRVRLEAISFTPFLIHEFEIDFTRRASALFYECVRILLQLSSSSDLGQGVRRTARADSNHRSHSIRTQAREKSGTTQAICDGV